MKRIPLKEITSAIGCAYSSDNIVNGFCIDSRLIEPGDLFFALPGNKVDGHSFLKEIQKKGAAGAIVHESFRSDEIKIPLILVPDVLQALQLLAQKTLQKNKTKVIGITGSIGKTTTKDFVFHLIKDSFSTFANPASYNSQITMPLSILMAQGDEEYIVLEMAMTHPGQIAKLVSIAPPTISLLTTVAVQHACNFSDGLAGICREKSSIFCHPDTHLGILPKELPHAELALNCGTCPKVTFSISNRNADYYLENTDNSSLKIYENAIPYELNCFLPIKALYHNLLGAIVLVRSLGVDWEVIQSRASSLQLPKMRFEEIRKQGITFINDAYNANPDATKAALESLPKPAKHGKTIAVLSEMTELGMYTESGHAIVAEAALQHADCLLCIGSGCETMKKIWKREKKTVELFEVREDLEKHLLELVNPGDVVLLKGARSWALDKVLRLFE